MKLEELRQSLLWSGKSEAGLASLIDRLSQNFTTTRENISNYLSDERLVSAYTYFYFPTNMAKMKKILEHIKLSAQNLDQFNIVEIGCGPGTYLYSLYELGVRTEFVGIETAPLMREQGEKLWKNFYQDMDISFKSSSQNLTFKTEKPILMIFGHSANEMDNSVTLNYINDLSAQRVLFIEPGTKQFFAKMRELRAILINQKFNICYPCSSNTLCPLSESDWCHQILKVELDAELKRLCQLVKKDRITQPVSLFYFEKDLNYIMRDSANIVRVFGESKFGFEYLICHKDEMNESDLVISHIQQLKKTLSKKAQKKLATLMAGDGIEFSEIKSLGNGIKRVEIGEVKE